MMSRLHRICGNHPSGRDKFEIVLLNLTFTFLMLFFLQPKTKDRINFPCLSNLD